MTDWFLHRFFHCSHLDPVFAYRLQCVLCHPRAGTPPLGRDWSRDTTGGIRTHGRHLVDLYGGCDRVYNFRGVNLSGNCKRFVPL
ncbi:hypothetical protein DFH94DRAFT_755861 [Russula ochroleuca]|uniref:Uncharacterized protein n=1 Tax=Russula ochroleuca TaxID=152965 RepID=A0A9P5MSU3_9AGAM|nr:hypothetical protein DFH94DRAFT_755861 [Russula ochroleuca]